MIYRLKAARKSAGLSTRELAAKLGVSAMAVSKWETGKVKPDSTRLLAISKATGKPPSFFVESERLTLVWEREYYDAHGELRCRSL